MGRYRSHQSGGRAHKVQRRHPGVRQGQAEALSDHRKEHLANEGNHRAGKEGIEELVEDTTWSHPRHPLLPHSYSIYYYSVIDFYVATLKKKFECAVAVLHAPP